MPFDPCREWLGIDATDLKDPHRVLAIPPTETDGDTIARLAEERLSALSRIEPGPFAKAHAVLMTRVAEARDTLLATATWAMADDPPREEPALTPPPAPQVIPPPPPPPQFIPPPLTMIPVDPVVPEEMMIPAVMDPSPASALDTEPPAPEWTTPSVRATSSSGGSALGLFAIFLALAIGVGYYMYKKLRVAEVGWQVALRSLVEPQSDPEPIDPAPPLLPPELPPAPAPEPVAVVESPTPSVPEPSVPTPSPQEPPPVEPLPSIPPPPPPPSEPDPETEKRLAAERARTAELVSLSLDKAFQSLTREEFDAADRAIEEAWNAVGDDVESANRVERWRLLAGYARGYNTFKNKAFKAAGSGREYEIDGRRIVVIEVTPTNFIYRLAGKNYNVARKTMSPVLECGVVEAWFGGDGRAANYLYLGARWLCKERPNPDRARTAWQKAADGGEEAGPLMALLDDPITKRPDGP